MTFFVLSALISSSDDDADLINRLKARDPDALRETHERFSRIAYTLIARIVRDPGTAEDLLQETFLKVWNRIQGFHVDRGNLGPWIMTIARNRAIDHLRSREGRFTPAGGSLELLEQPHMLPNTEAEYQALDQIRVIRRVFEKLSPNQRRVLELAYFEGLSQTEMAEQMNQPLGTVKTWVRTALQTLRQELG